MLSPVHLVPSQSAPWTSSSGSPSRSRYHTSPPRTGNIKHNQDIISNGKVWSDVQKYRWCKKIVKKIELNFLPEGTPQHHQQRGQPWQRLQTDKDEEHNLQNKSCFIFQPKQLEFYLEANNDCCKRHPVSWLLARLMIFFLDFDLKPTVMHCFDDWFNQFLKHLLFPHQQSQQGCGQRRAVEKINEKSNQCFDF